MDGLAVGEDEAQPAERWACLDTALFVFEDGLALRACVTIELIRELHTCPWAIHNAKCNRLFRQHVQAWRLHFDVFLHDQLCIQPLFIIHLNVR